MADIHKQIAEAKVECAKFALAYPYATPEGLELSCARSNFHEAKVRLEQAQARWEKRIAPAKGWAPDPLKEQQS